MSRNSIDRLKLAKLEEYASLMNDEYAEYLDHMANLARYDYCLKQPLIDALRASIEAELKLLREEAEIVTTTETITRKQRTIKWKECP